MINKVQQVNKARVFVNNFFNTWEIGTAGKLCGFSKVFLSFKTILRADFIARQHVRRSHGRVSLKILTRKLACYNVLIELLEAHYLKGDGVMEFLVENVGVQKDFRLCAAEKATSNTAPVRVYILVVFKQSFETIFLISNVISKTEVIFEASV